MNVRSVSLRPIAAALLLLAAATPARAGEPDGVLLGQPADVQFTLPTISVILPELDGGPTTCTYDLTGNGSISRAAGGSNMTERGSVKGTTNCSRNLTAMLTIVDTAAGGQNYRVSCMGSGFRAATCPASQSVPYFTSAALTRPVSTVVFRYQLFAGNQEKVCFEYRVTMVGATEGTHGAGPCDASAL